MFGILQKRLVCTICFVLFGAVLTGAGYDRDEWMPSGWEDADHNCLDTRQEVLVQESLIPVKFSDDGCKVTGGLWICKYSGEVLTDPAQLDIDHLIPLKNAYDSGASHWSASTKKAYANYLDDPDHLIAVRAKYNRSKGSKGPEDWKPPLKASWCEYAIAWSRIKRHWNLSMKAGELAAIVEMVSTCPNPSWELKE